MGVVVRRYIDILIIIRTFPYSICNKKEECQLAVFYFARRARKMRYYGDVIP